MQRGARESHPPGPATPISGSDALHGASSGTDPSPMESASTAAEGVASAELIAACGVSYRQLDYAVRSGLVKANSRHTDGSGHPRHFSLTEASGLFIIARLREVTNSRVNLRGLVEKVCQGPGAMTIPLAPGMELKIDPTAIRDHLLQHRPNSPPKARES